MTHPHSSLPKSTIDRESATCEGLVDPGLDELDVEPTARNSDARNSDVGNLKNTDAFFHHTFGPNAVPTANASPEVQIDASQRTSAKTPSTFFPASRANHPHPANHPYPAEHRIDCLTGAMVVIAPDRAARPDDFASDESATASQWPRPSARPAVRVAASTQTRDCPFCAGHESSTPPAVWTAYSDDSAEFDQPRRAAWNVRVVPNRYPAVSDLPHPNQHCVEPTSIEPTSIDPISRRPIGERPIGGDRSSMMTQSFLFPSRIAAGGHEVIIESSRHVRSTSELTACEVRQTFLAYRDRLQRYEAMDQTRYASIFKNVGVDAGASLAHAHSQMIVLSEMPPMVDRSVETMVRFRAQTGCCLQCELIRRETALKSRVIASDHQMIAFCPFASTHAMMVRVTPKQHGPAFITLSDDAIDNVAQFVRWVVARMERTVGMTDYNYVLHTRPLKMNDQTEAFHWWLDLMPRSSKVAGFEWGTGMMINAVPPETAAKRYRGERLTQ